MSTSSNSSEQFQNPVALLQHLIRFDTTNPPGNEAGCIAFIHDLLSDAGIQSQIVASAPQRANLVARLPGRGQAPPLLLYGHVDVVTTAGQQWAHPPFEAVIEDGFVWGRGALDMKGEVAMMLAALLRAKAQAADLPGDVIFAALSDEEVGGEFGARFLVEQHAHLFSGVRYALGEFGGFNLEVAGRRFYPIMTAEKQICALKARLRGPAGHGSLPIRGGAMAKLARMLQRLERQWLPVHVTPVARAMFATIAAGLPSPMGTLLRQVLNPPLTDRILGLLGARGQLYAPLLHNTVSATMLQGSDKINVIPGEVEVGLDGRLLPGFGPEVMLRELQAVVGDDVELEVAQFEPGPTEPDMGLFAMLGDILKRADPQGTPVPLLLSGVTDARFFTRLGIQTYGFTPLQLPEGFNFTETIHAADERVPVAALEFGAQAIGQALLRFGESKT